MDNNLCLNIFVDDAYFFRSFIFVSDLSNYFEKYISQIIHLQLSYESYLKVLV